MIRWSTFELWVMGALLLLAALLFMAGAAQAQMVQMQLDMPCWPHPVIIKMLGDKYKEVPHSFGITKKSLVELYVSPSGSWTLMTTAPLGLTCVIGGGEGWEQLPVTKYGDPT